MDAKYLEAHRALEKKIAVVNADARRLLASGAKVDSVVKSLEAAGQTMRSRVAGIAAHLVQLESEAKAKAEADAKAKADAEAQTKKPSTD